jgi:hypothetical protein
LCATRVARQVFDRPEIRLRSIEHRAERRRCGLWDGGGRRVPAQARAAACYGRESAGLVCYPTVWDMALVPRAR